MRRYRLILSSLILCAAASLFAQNNHNSPSFKGTPVPIPFFTTKPIIDGKLDDEVWKQASVFQDFIQVAPGDGAAPSKPTVALMGYDEKFLYIAFYCYDEADKIRATVAKRDAILNEDNVKIWLDTYNDQRRAFELAFNPLGIQQDGIYTEGQGTDLTVDIVMESKGLVISDGWTLEVKIPFRSLRYAAGRNKIWGMHLSRIISRFNNENDSWMPLNRSNSSFLSQAGKITNLDNIKTERTLQIIPSITVSETGNRKRTLPISAARQYGYHPLYNPGGITDPGRFVDNPIKGDLGVNVKFNFTSNVTMDIAVNPDFAEIEADSPVVTANQRFPIFFEEKRPFFLEGVDIFQSPLQIFYSRTIVDPDYAGKLTGKTGKNSFGFLVASDKAPGNYSEDERNDPDPAYRNQISEFVDKNAFFGVVRLKRDIGKENSAGFFSTARVFPEQRNLTGGFDGRIRFSPQTKLQFQVLGTNSRRCFFASEFEPSIEPFQAQRNREICGSTFNSYRTGNGFGYFTNLDYTEKNRGFYLEVSGRSPDYHADSGFTRRTNTNSVYVSHRLSTEPKPKAKVVRINWMQFARLNYDWKGRSQDGFLGTGLEFNLQRNLLINVESGVAYFRLFEEEFGLRRSGTRGGAFFGEAERSTFTATVAALLRMTPSKKFSFQAFIRYVPNSFDFDFGGGLRFPRTSPAALLNPSAPLDPGTGREFNFSTSLEYKPIRPLRMSIDYYKSRLIRNDNKRTAFDSNIVIFRSTYQFTRFTLVRMRLDWNSITSNAIGQFLLGWSPSPGKALYVGYNDNFNYNGFSPFTNQFEPQFERNSRTFFIRASYLFQKSF